MGQLLSHPVEDKTIEGYSYETLSYCVGSMQGYRMSMEDAHNIKVNEYELLAMFSVFDGHGGKQVSEYLSHHLTKTIFRSLNQYQHHHHLHSNYSGEHHHHRHSHSPHSIYSHSNSPTLSESNIANDGVPSNTDNVNSATSHATTVHSKDESSANTESHLTDYISIIKDSFFKVDHDLYKLGGMNNCGSTAIVITIIQNRYIIVANTGDSRCILSLDGAAKTLSFDHKPVIMNERIRIENSNGYILNNRINEILALSRAFGDFKFKSPVLDSTSNKFIIQNKKYFKNGLINMPPELFQVTVEPDFLVYDLKSQILPEFLVLACDGIWDCYKNSKLISVIRNKLGLGWKLNKIVEFILHDCLSMANNYTGIGFDNMTIIIVAIHPNNDMEQWYEQMVRKIHKEKGLID